MKSDKKINHAWYKQVAEFEWNFFGTATLKDKITKTAAKKRFARFIQEARGSFGPDFRCVYATEDGDSLKPSQVHFLVGGLLFSPSSRRQLQHLWNRTGGISHVVHFDEALRKAGLRYLLKTVRAGHTDQIGFVVRDQGEKPHLTNGATPSRTISSTRRKVQMESRGRSGKLNADNAPRSRARKTRAGDGLGDRNSGTLTLPAITIKRGEGFHVHRENDFLVIALPLTPPRPSKSSGKTHVVGSTGGLRPTLAESNGRPIFVNVVAIIKPKGPAWKQSVAPLLARSEGKLV